MKTRAFVGIVAAFALSGCNGGSQQGTKSSSADAGGTPVTLVGCLIPGSASASSSAVGTSGNAESGFSLIDVTTSSMPASSPGTTSGASGTPGSSGTAGTPPAGNNPAVDTGAPRSYGLVSDKKDDLLKFQNSRVEVTGMLIASADTGASAPAGTPATDVQRVRVQTIRQVESSCR